MNELVVRSLFVAVAFGLTPRPGVADPGKNLGPVPAPAEAGAALRRVPRAFVIDVYESTDVPKAIADNDPTGITSALTVALPVDLPVKIADVNLILDSLPHTCTADLHVELTSPAGTTVPLLLNFLENGILGSLLCSADFTNTVFDDEALANLLEGTAPYSGYFNVDHPSVAPFPLSGFRGEDAAGTWTLAVSDRANGDTGSLDGWSLEIFVDTFDNYECYKAKDLKQPKFVPVEGVSLITPVQPDTVDVRKPTLVCLPANKDGTGVTEFDIAQCCYQVKGTALKPPFSAQVSDDFGTLQLSLSKPALLCQPCSVQTAP